MIINIISNQPIKYLTLHTVFVNHRKKSLIQEFNIASEASYVYILSGKKFIKNAKINKLKLLV